MTPPCPDCRTSPCPACRLAALMRDESAAVPCGFADRAFVAVVRDRRRRTQRRWATRAGLAAGLLVAVGFAADGLRPAARVEFAEAVPAAPTTATPMNPLGDVREALSSVTQRAGETALAPTRNLIAGLGEPTPPPAPPVDPPTPSVSVAMLDPLTDTTRRAVSAFLKDVRQLSTVNAEVPR